LTYCELKVESLRSARRFARILVNSPQYKASIKNAEDKETPKNAEASDGEDTDSDNDQPEVEETQSRRASLSEPEDAMPIRQNRLLVDSWFRVLSLLDLIQDYFASPRDESGYTTGMLR
jgi:hypothetical protein